MSHHRPDWDYIRPQEYNRPDERPRSYNSVYIDTDPPPRDLFPERIQYIRGERSSASLDNRDARDPNPDSAVHWRNNPIYREVRRDTRFAQGAPPYYDPEEKYRTAPARPAHLRRSSNASSGLDNVNSARRRSLSPPQYVQYRVPPPQRTDRPAPRRNQSGDPHWPNNTAPPGFRSQSPESSRWQPSRSEPKREYNAPGRPARDLSARSEYERSDRDRDTREYNSYIGSRGQQDLQRFSGSSSDHYTRERSASLQEGTRNEKDNAPLKIGYGRRVSAPVSAYDVNRRSSTNGQERIWERPRPPEHDTIQRRKSVPSTAIAIPESALSRGTTYTDKDGESTIPESSNSVAETAKALDLKTTELNHTPTYVPNAKDTAVDNAQARGAFEQYDQYINPFDLMDDTSSVDEPEMSPGLIPVLTSKEEYNGLVDRVQEDDSTAGKSIQEENLAPSNLAVENCLRNPAESPSPANDGPDFTVVFSRAASEASTIRLDDPEPSVGNSITNLVPPIQDEPLLEESSSMPAQKEDSHNIDGHLDAEEHAQDDGQANHAEGIGASLRKQTPADDAPPPEEEVMSVRSDLDSLSIGSIRQETPNSTSEIESARASSQLLKQARITDRDSVESHSPNQEDVDRGSVAINLEEQNLADKLHSKSNENESMTETFDVASPRASIALSQFTSLSQQPKNELLWVTEPEEHLDKGSGADDKITIEQGNEHNTLDLSILRLNDPEDSRVPSDAVPEGSAGFTVSTANETHLQDLGFQSDEAIALVDTIQQTGGLQTDQSWVETPDTREDHDTLADQEKHYRTISEILPIAENGTDTLINSSMAELKAELDTVPIATSPEPIAASPEPFAASPEYQATALSHSLQAVADPKDEAVSELQQLGTISELQQVEAVPELQQVESVSELQQVEHEIHLIKQKLITLDTRKEVISVTRHEAKELLKQAALARANFVTQSFLPVKKFCKPFDPTISGKVIAENQASANIVRNLQRRRLYNEPQDYPFYQRNLDEFAAKKDKLIAFLSIMHESLKAEEDDLRQEYEERQKKWLKHAARCDRQRLVDSDQYEADVANTAAGGSRGTRNKPVGYEIAEALSSVDTPNNVLNEAVIPRCITDPFERELYSYLDLNHLVDDPLKFYHIGTPDSGDIWTEEEQNVFFARYKATPKQFGTIAAGLPGRTAQDCVLHYYKTKKVLDYRTTGKARAKTSGRGRGRGRKIVTGRLTRRNIMTSTSGLEAEEEELVDETEVKSLRKRRAITDIDEVQRKTRALRKPTKKIAEASTNQQPGPTQPVPAPVFAGRVDEPLALSSGATMQKPPQPSSQQTLRPSQPVYHSAQQSSHPFSDRKRPIWLDQEEVHFVDLLRRYGTEWHTIPPRDQIPGKTIEQCQKHFDEGLIERNYRQYLPRPLISPSHPSHYNQQPPPSAPFQQYGARAPLLNPPHYNSQYSNAPSSSSPYGEGSNYSRPTFAGNSYPNPQSALQSPSSQTYQQVQQYPFDYRHNAAPSRASGPLRQPSIGRSPGLPPRGSIDSMLNSGERVQLPPINLRNPSTQSDGRYNSYYNPPPPQNYQQHQQHQQHQQQQPPQSFSHYGNPLPSQDRYNQYQQPANPHSAPNTNGAYPRGGQSSWR